MHYRVEKIVFLVLILVACKKVEYKKAEEGVYYRISSAGEYSEDTSRKKVIEASVFLIEERNTLLVDSLYYFFVTEDMSEGFRQIMYKLERGDTCYILASAKKINSIIKLPSKNGNNKNLHIMLIVRNVMDEQSYLKSTYAIGGKSREQNMIRYLLSKYKKREDETYNDGIYILEFKQGRGAFPKKDNIVIMHYRGYLPDGFLFDNTFDWGKPFQWQVGVPDQIIPGLEKIVLKMKQGAYARVLIPSELAYGAEGSISGIVPPYTPVIYEVWVLWVVP